MTSFGELTTATRIRDVIASIVRDIMGAERPLDVYATVQSIDRTSRTATVLFPGTDAAITLPMGAIQPVGAGGTVRVVGGRGDRRIEAPSGADALYLDANTVAATTGNITGITSTTGNIATLTSTTGNITTGNITTGNITTGNITTGNVTTANITDGTASNTLRATKTTEPALGATTHGFEVGTPGITTGQTGLMFGPSKIQAKNGATAAAVELNPSGGAVRANGFPVTPLRAIGTAISASPPAVTATSPGYQFQAGIASVTFTNAIANFALPNAFPTGLLCCLATSNVGGHILAVDVGLSSRTNIHLDLRDATAEPTALATPGVPVAVTYLAIGW